MEAASQKFESNLITEDHYVVIVDNSGNRKVVKADNGRIHHYKCNIDLTEMVGHPFNTVFAVDDRQSGKLSVVTDPQSVLTSAFFTGIEDDAAVDPD